MLRPCKPSSPSGTTFRSWRFFPLSTATAVSSMSFSTGSSGITGRSHRKRRFTRALLVSLGIGTRKIARISRQISEPELENTVNRYFSPNATQAANDKVLHLMDRMELPNRYRRSQEVLHTSSDGQKFEVKVESLNANHSFKYFGKGKGVSVYSFIDERHLLFHSTVSAAERESAYVIDGLMHNDVVKSDVHSTDTHGYSEMIFGTMHLLAFSYAPQIKNLKRQRLYTFLRRSGWDRTHAKVAPSGYIDTQIIVDNWGRFLRFIATIKSRRRLPRRSSGDSTLTPNNMPSTER